MERLINLRAAVDQVLVFRFCRQPCRERCGTCIACRRACPDDCRQGIEDGTGHVFALSDRVPVYQVEEIQETARGLLELPEDDPNIADVVQERLARARRLVLDLFRREYPDLTAEQLDRVLSYDDYAVVLFAFLPRLTAPSTKEQTPSPTATPTRKRSRRS